MPEQRSPKAWPRRLRISVRGLIILMLVVGGWLGWIVHRARVRRDAVMAIELAGGEVMYDREWRWTYGRPVRIGTIPRPAWLVGRIGVDDLSSVTYVALRYRGTDELLEQVGQHRKIEYLSLAGSPVGDAGLVHLEGLTSLRSLSLAGTRVTDAGLVHLKGLTRLETLSLDLTRVSDAGLAPLKTLTGLKRLSLDLTRVSDAGLQDLRRALPTVRIVMGGGAARVQARAMDLGEKAAKAKADPSPSPGARAVYSWRGPLHAGRCRNEKRTQDERRPGFRTPESRRAGAHGQPRDDVGHRKWGVPGPSASGGSLQPSEDAKAAQCRGLVVVDLDDLRQADDLGAELKGVLHRAELDLAALRLSPAHQLEDRGEARAAEVGHLAEVHQDPLRPVLGQHRGQLVAQLLASCGPCTSLVRISTTATSLTMLRRRCWKSASAIDGSFRDRANVGWLRPTGSRVDSVGFTHPTRRAVEVRYHFREEADRVGRAPPSRPNASRHHHKR